MGRMLHGQVLISEAGIVVGTGPTGERAMILSPANSQLQIIVPLSAEACKSISEALIAPQVAKPTPADIEIVRRNGRPL